MCLLRNVWGPVKNAHTVSELGLLPRKVSPSAPPWQSRKRKARSLKAKPCILSWAKDQDRQGQSHTRVLRLFPQALCSARKQRLSLTLIVIDTLPLNSISFAIYKVRTLMVPPPQRSTMKLKHGKSNLHSEWSGNTIAINPM